MYSNDFEEAFSNFLDRHEYDEAENYLFSMVRLAFAAGWRAAGGQPPQSEAIYELIVPGRREGERRPLSPSGENILKIPAGPLDTGAGE